MQAALCVAFILITVLLFWFGLASTNSENNLILDQINKADKSLGKTNGDIESNSSDGLLGAAAQDRPGSSANRFPSPKIRAKTVTQALIGRCNLNASDKSFDAREMLEMHQRVLRGELFLTHLTTTIESNPSAKKMLLDPFSSVSLKIGHKQITSSLFAITLSELDKGEPLLVVSVQGKTQTSAKLLRDLFQKAYLEMLEEENSDVPLLTKTADIADAIKHKTLDIDDLREQIQKQETAKPVSSVEEISFRAELDQCESELTEAINVLTTVQKARQKGASFKQLALLPGLSRKGNLAEYVMRLDQLRKLKNSDKGRKASIQDELNRQIAQSEQNLESELLGVITSLKSRCDKNISRRNALRTSLVELAKAKSIKNQENPRFRLLEQREKEVEDLQNRYELAVSKWRFAKESLIFDSETEQPKK